MRKAGHPAAFVSILVLAVGLVLGASTVCGAVGDLSGTLEIAVALDLSGAGSIIQTDSDTYSKLQVDYIIGDWTFGSLSTIALGVGELHAQEFQAFGSLGLIVLNSRLLFSPITGSGTALISDTKTADGAEHQYDLGSTYFVDWVSVTSITVVPPTAEWQIETSQDGASWDWHSGVFSGSVPSGQVHVGRLARYVRIRVTSGGGAYIDDSALTVSISAESWSGTARFTTSSMTLTAGWALATESSAVSFGVIGSHAGNLAVEGTVYFDIVKPDCSFCFDRFVGKFVFPFCCLDRITSTLEISKTGFDKVSFAVTGLGTGLAGITFDARLAFLPTEKSVTLTPVLNLGDTTCFTLYSSLSLGSTPIEITGLLVYGIRLLCSVNGVEFESVTYLDDIHYTKEDYWEMFRISVDGATCCSGMFDFEITTHFGSTHTSLFDWAETEVETQLGLSEDFSFSIYSSFTAAGTEELVFGFEVTW